MLCTVEITLCRDAALLYGVGMDTNNPLPALTRKLAAAELTSAIQGRNGGTPWQAETRIAELEAEIEQETRSLMSAGLHPSQR